jgi:hypothetical protein
LEPNNLDSNSDKKDKIKKNDKFTYSFSIGFIGPEIVKIDVKSDHYKGTVNTYVYSTEDYDFICATSMNSATRLHYDYLIANEMVVILFCHQLY